MRLLPLLVLVLPAVAGADRLIFAPIAAKLRLGSVRLEAGAPLSSGRRSSLRLLVPVSDVVEIEARDSGGRIGLDLYATILSPFTGYSPGIAFGAFDVLGRTSDGRRVWAATTFRMPAEVGGETLSADWSGGFIVGRRLSPFAAVNYPLDRSVRLLAEYDGLRFAAGIQRRVTGDLEARAFVRGGAATLSLRGYLRF